MDSSDWSNGIRYHIFDTTGYVVDIKLERGHVRGHAANAAVAAEEQHAQAGQRREPGPADTTSVGVTK